MVIPKPQLPRKRKTIPRPNPADHLGDDYLYDPLFFLEVLNARNHKEFKFSEWQTKLCIYIRDSLNKIVKGEGEGNINIAISGGRGTGKTTLMAYYALWVLVISSNKQAIVRLTAYNDYQAKNVLIAKVTKVLEDAGFWDLVFRSGARVFKSADNPENTILAKLWSSSSASGNQNDKGQRGEHAEFGLRIFDEAPSIPDAVFKDAMTGLTSGINITLLLGNPYAIHGFFYEVFAGDNVYNFHNVHVSQYECDHIPVDTESFKARVEAIKRDDPSGDLYRVEVLGQFPLHNKSCFFSSVPEVTPCEYFPPFEGVVGIDIATGEGNDRTVIAERINGVIYIRYVGLCKLEELSDRIYHISRATKKIAIDSACIGTAVKQRLAGRGVRVRPVLGNDPAGDRRAFNKRAELHLKLRDFFEMGGQVCCVSGEVETTKTQLRQTKSELTERGTIRMEDKKKLPKSPDILDAMTYTFAYNEYTHNYY